MVLPIKMISKTLKIVFVLLLVSEIVFSIIYSQLMVSLNNQFQHLQSQVNLTNELNLQLTKKFSQATSIKSLLGTDSAKILSPTSHVINQN
jgi:hypothetical protein